MLRDLLMTDGNQRRGGKSTPTGTLDFLARQALVGDTIAFVPYHREDAPITVADQRSSATSSKTAAGER